MPVSALLDRFSKPTISLRPIISFSRTLDCIQPRTGTQGVAEISLQGLQGGVIDEGNSGATNSQASFRPPSDVTPDALPHQVPLRIALLQI